MNTLVLRTAARWIHPLLLLLSVLLLFKGHHEPGGGFVGGLLAAAAFALHVLGSGTGSVRSRAQLEPRPLMAVGLLLSLASGLPALGLEAPFGKALWEEVELPGLGPTLLGTPMLFDLGVYFVVLGVSLKIILLLAEENP